MKLSKSNIVKWKIKLDIEALIQIGMAGYSETLNDEDWLDMHEDDTVQDVIAGEIDAMYGCI